MNKILVLICIVCLMITGCKENIGSKEAASEYLQITSGEPQYSEESSLGITEADVLLIRKKVEKVESNIFVSSYSWRCSENDEGTVAIPSEETETGFEFYYMCQNFDTREKIMSYLTTALTMKNAKDEITSRIDSGLLAEIDGEMSIVPLEGTDTLDWDNAKVIAFHVEDKSAEATIQVFDVGFNTYDTYEGSYIYENGWKEDSLKVKAPDADRSNE